MTCASYPLSNPSKEYAEECFIDAIHHAATRNPELPFDDLLAAMDNVRGMAREVFDDAQPDPNAASEARAMQRAWEGSRL